MDGAADFVHKTAEEISDQLSVAVRRLHRLINITEEKYSYIYETLPLVEKDVALSGREIEILLRHLIFRGSAGDSVIKETLDEVMDEMQKVTANFLDQDLIQSMTEIFLQGESENGQSFSELGKVVTDVESSIDALRDLALNSIIYSIRLGSEGAAFQVISDRINYVALELGSHFNVMKPAIDGLNQWNVGFKNRLQAFIDYQTEFKTQHILQVKDKMSDAEAMLGAVSNLMADNLQKTQQAFGQVGQVMVMIQNQDIIRQNIENLIKCLNITREKQYLAESGEQEHLLDYVVFADRVLRLTETLISNVEESLLESMGGLQQVLREMAEVSADLELDTRYLPRFFVKGAADGQIPGAITTAFAIIKDQVENLLLARERIMAESNLLRDKRQKYADLMSVVEKNLDAINRQGRALKKMRVLIKIELARVDLNSSFSVKSIVEAIDQVIETIDHNQQVFLGLRDFFLKNLNSFDEWLEVTAAKLCESGPVLEDIYERVELVQKLTCGAVLAMETEMLGIFANIKQVTGELAENSIMDQLILEATETIIRAQGMASQVKQQLFEHLGLSEWEEKEAGLREIRQQFTCFTERKALNALTGHGEQDIGGEGGDIVLF